jgi:acyl-CoA reductase-like NAD-dependent aldehyde dehydrogenase
MFMAKAPAEHKFLVDGRWLAEGELVEIRSPFSGEVVGRTWRGNAGHAEAAIAAAVRAFETTRRMASFERQRILREVSEGIADRAEEFAQSMAREAGKPLKAGRVEVERAVVTFEVAAEEATRIGGEWLSLDHQAATAGRWGILRRFALGPVAAITPFNFPLNLVAHKLSPAIAAGCTVVLKPAPQAPFCALLLAELIEKAGWPAGALNVVNLSNEDAAALVEDNRLKLLTFTGSGPVGWALKSRAGKKRVALELGGNAAVIVHSDADIEYAAERGVAGGFSYAGQSCISVQRLFVHRSVAHKFQEAFLARVAKLKTGDPLDETTDIGPLINEGAARRVVEWVEEAVRGGARLLTGGKRNGSVVEATVLTNTRPEMRVNCEEVFGPLVVMEEYDEFEEAIRRANDSPYGLQAGLFTQDARLIFMAYERLEVGGVIVGDTSAFRADQMPYGGTKESGMGRKGLRYAIEEMTEPKLLVMNLR